MTKKEAILAIYKGEKADFIPDVGNIQKEIVYPGDRFIDFANFDPYGTGPDAWGVIWQNCGPNPGIDGNTVAKDFRLFENVEDWKEHVRFPEFDDDFLSMVFGAMEHGMAVDRENDIVSCLILSGCFERLNQMVGMENALCAFYECPEELHEFFDAMCEYKLGCIEKAHRLLKPDVIHMQDDWGTNNNMFFSPEHWREFIKPREAKIAAKIHELGMLYIHHSCGYIKQIIPDLIEISVDVINPVNVCNDLDDCLEKYGDKITFLGGLDNQKMEKDPTEETIRGEVRRAMDAYAKKGRYIPYCIPASEHVWLTYRDEVDKYGLDIFG